MRWRVSPVVLNSFRSGVVTAFAFDFGANDVHRAIVAAGYFVGMASTNDLDGCASAPGLDSTKLVGDRVVRWTIELTELGHRGDSPYARTVSAKVQSRTDFTEAGEIRAVARPLATAVAD